MKFAKDTSGIERYIAIDIHKEYALVGGQNASQDWVLQPRWIGSEMQRVALNNKNPLAKVAGVKQITKNGHERNCSRGRLKLKNLKSLAFLPIFSSP